MPFLFRGVQTHLSSRCGSQRHEGEERVPHLQGLKGPCSEELYKERGCGMGSRTRTGNADESQHPSPSRVWRAGCEAQCFATMFTFLMLFFRGRTCLGALQKLLSLGPKNSINWLQMDLASPGLSVELLASPDHGVLTGGLSLIQISLNIWVVSF